MLSLELIPKNWNDIKFQNHIVAPLKGGFEKKDVPNVVLLKGGSGLGKTSIAKVFAANILCSNRGMVFANESYKGTWEEMEKPCGVCISCAAIFGGQPLANLYYINGREEGGVAFYRDFISKLQSKASLYGDKKVAIIDEAHGLSKEALETLLTPLENPNNSHMFVILCTTEGLSIPKALQSRSMAFNVRRPDDMELATYYQEIIVNKKWDASEDFCVDGVLKIIDLTEGNVREGLNILHQLSLSGDFSVKAVDNYSYVTGGIPIDDIVKKVFAGSYKTALTDIEKALDNSDITSFFGKFFDEIFTLYRYKVLGLSLKYGFIEKKMDSKYPRVPTTRIKSLTESLIEVKKACGNTIDKSVFFYYLTKNIGA